MIDTPPDCLEPCDGSVRGFAERSLGPGPLAERASFVLAALPAAVRDDLLHDPRFRLTVEVFTPATGRSVFLACPAGHGGGSRSVVLRPRLASCGEAFAWYVIAHELAHAFLRNGAWGDIHDPEHAADALAAAWGFPRPA